MRKLLVNAWQTPDGTVLESRHRHDFKMHSECVAENSRVYFVDGGLDYIRCSAGMLFVGCYSDDPHEVIRDTFSWGSYGKDGQQEKHYILLKFMTDDHIRAILDTQKHIKGTVVEKVFKAELKYRSKNGTSISNNS
jgi:hypothetical protein